jgi:hypothetical protein
MRWAKTVGIAAGILATLLVVVFLSGYRSGMTGMSLALLFAADIPHRTAHIQGWYDGQRDGLARSPEPKGSTLLISSESPSELAARLLELQHEREIFEGYRSQKTNQVARLASSDVRQRLATEFTWEKLKPLFISIYTNAYSPAELKAYVDFYSSPEGEVRMERWRQTRAAIGPMLERKAAELGVDPLR